MLHFIRNKGSLFRFETFHHYPWLYFFLCFEIYLTFLTYSFVQVLFVIYLRPKIFDYEVVLLDLEILRSIECKKLELKFFSQFSFALFMYPWWSYRKIIDALFQLLHFLSFPALLSDYLGLVKLILKVIHFLSNQPEFPCLFLPVSLPLDVLLNLEFLLHSLAHLQTMLFLHLLAFLLWLFLALDDWFFFTKREEQFLFHTFFQFSL